MFLLDEHRQLREGIDREFNRLMEETINENQDKDSYYILGKLKFPPEHGGKVGKIFLAPIPVMPPVVTESFCYFVDNKRGAKQLVWTSSKTEVIYHNLGKKYQIHKDGRMTPVAVECAANSKGAEDE